MSDAISLPDRVNLISAIAGDRRCGRVHLAIAFSLFCQFYNGTTGRCDPSVGTLAKAAASDRRYARQVLCKLEEWGYLRIEIGGGMPGKFGATNAYIPCVPAQGMRSSTGGDPLRCSAGEALQRPNPLRPSAPKPVIEPVVDLSVDSDRDGASPFETFWRAYPSRRPHPNPKKPACSKFEAAVKRGVDSAEIIRGAERYAAYTVQSATDPKFIAQAKTWLGQERWTENHEASQPKRRPGMC